MENSFFSRLPLELRELIYNYTLYHPEGITIAGDTKRPELQRRWSDGPFNHSLYGNKPRKPIHPVALTATCSQIRSECSSIFYNLNTFNIIPEPSTTFDERPNVPPSDSNPEINEDSLVIRWLNSLTSSNRSALRHINIDLGTWTPTGRTTTGLRFLPSRPTPVQVAFYLNLISNLSPSVQPFDHPNQQPCKLTFTLTITFSDIETLSLGTFVLHNFDMRSEISLPGTQASLFERASLSQAEKIRRANLEGLIDGFGVIMLMMGLDRCRGGFAEFLDAVAVELERRA